MLVEKKVSEKKLPSWQANNFSDLNLCGKFPRIFKNGGKNVDRLSGVEIFRIFFNGICEAEM